MLQLKLTMDPKGFAHGNVDCCASKEIAPATQEVLINESLRCDPVALGKIMADHTQVIRSFASKKSPYNNGIALILFSPGGFMSIF